MPAGRDYLVKNVEPLGKLGFPVRKSRLIDNQIQALRARPFFEHVLFTKHNRLGFDTRKGVVNARRINNIELPMQIKNQAASAVQRAFVNDIAAVAGMAVEESSSVGQRKVLRHSRHAVDHSQTDRHHGGCNHGRSQSPPSGRAEKDGDQRKQDQQDAYRDSRGQHRMPDRAWNFLKRFPR